MNNVVRNIVKIDEDLCNGCGQCILDCAEGAIALIDGKAKVIADMYCDGLGACLGGCPTGALTIIQRKADAYDEAAVEEHLAKQGRTLHHAPAPNEPRTLCGCTHATPQEFSHLGAAPQKTASTKDAHTPPPSLAPLPLQGALSESTHWPVKLRLMTPHAPFLRGANILLAADCSAFAMPHFHASFAKNHVMLIACPKFEGMDAIAQQLAAICAVAKPKSCTVVRMEVPCCQGLLRACHAAKELCADVPEIHDCVVTRQGTRKKT